MTNYFEEIFKYTGSDICKNKKSLFWEKYEKFKNIVPFDIMTFAKELGINIFVSSSLEQGESGKIEFDGCKIYSVYVNSSDSLARKIFTIAHEIGHFICDTDYLEKHKRIIDGEAKYQKTCLQRKENNSDDDIDLIKRDVRANKFAAELLMPTDKFIEIWKESKNPEEVAKRFGVSVEAVRVRASNLLGVII